MADNSHRRSVGRENGDTGHPKNEGETTIPGETDLETLLRSMHPRLRDGEFVFAAISGELPAGLAVEATIREDEGITVVAERAAAEAHQLDYRFVAAWITLDIHSGLEAVGLTGAFSAALADAGISCNVLAGYFHDHILVPVGEAERAMSTLRTLARGVRSGR